MDVFLLNVAAIDLEICHKNIFTAFLVLKNVPLKLHAPKIIYYRFVPDESEIPNVF